jgi:hypothetical protein
MAAWFDAQSCLRLPQARLLDGASNATISAWIWFSSGQGGQILGAGDGRSGLDPITTRVNRGGAEDIGFWQVIPNNFAKIGFGNDEGIPGLSAPGWHLFTMVLKQETNGSMFRCYADTNLVKQSFSSAFSQVAYDIDMPALIGAIQADGPQQFWQGGIDELRIYNRALTPQQIEEIFYGGYPKLTIEISQVRLCWDSLTNELSQLQYRSELTTNVWVNLGAPIYGVETNICVSDDISMPRRFYRVIFPQANKGGR